MNAGSGTVTFGGTTAITNNGTMNLNAVTISTGFSMTAPSTTMGIAGNFTSTGTFINGGGTILFNGTSNLTAAEVYNNITVTGPVTSTGNFSQTVAGDLINNGTFDIGTGNLTWSGSGTLSGSGNTTIFDLNVTGTSCTYTATGILTLRDDILGAGSFNSSDPLAGPVIFAGAGSSIFGTGSKTFRTISVTGTLTPAVTYNLVGAGGIDVTGTLASGGTVVFAGSTQTITGSSINIAFNIFTTNVGSDLTITPDITINSNLTGNGNIIAAGTITFVGLTMSGTGTKNFNNVTVGTGTLTPNANYSIAGNLVVNGTLAAGNATTTFNGTTLVSGAGAATFNNVSITNTLTARTSSEPVLNINGNFTNTGTFNGSSGTVSLGGNFINNGTFNANTGTFVFNSTVSPARTITGSSSVTFNNLTIFDKGQNPDVINNMVSPVTVGIAGSLSFGGANAQLDADGSGSSVLTILSTGDSPAQDGRIDAITFAGSNITGNFTVQRFVSSEGSGRFYRYIASPVVGSTVADLQNAIPVTGTFADPSVCTGCISTNPSLFFYNETTNAYVAYPTAGLASANAFTNGRGYSAFFRHTGSGGVGNATINFVGTNPSTGNIALPVSPNASGLSLVGNPYPSAIRWDKGGGWAKTNIADGIVVRDNSTGVHQSYSAAAGTGVIAAGQSFWVQSSAAGASLTINQNAKSATTTSFFRLDQPIADELEIQLTKGSTGTTDAARIEIRTNSTSGNDSYDVFKFNNNLDDGNAITEVHDIAVLNASSMLMVSAIPSISCSEIFNLRVNDILNNGETTATYNLSLNPGGSFAALGWVLVDAKTGQEITMTAGVSYEFTVNSTDVGYILQSGSRFHLINRFSLKPVAVTINTALQLTAQNSLCSGSEGVITLANSQNGVTYGVEINGQLFPAVEQGNGANLNIFIPGENLVNGNNNIRIQANAGCETQFLSTAATINKEEVFQITQTSGASLCKPGSATLNAVASSSNASIRWYESESSTEVLSTDAQWITPSVNASKTYYVAAVNAAGCESLRVPVSIDVTDVTATIEIENSSLVCSGQSMTLTANSEMADGTYRWYETLTSTTPVGEGNSFTTPSLPKTTKYYVSLISPSGCEGTRKEVLANVASYNPDLTSVAESTEICVGGSHSLTAQGAPAGSTYFWFDSMDASTPLQEGALWITPQLTATKTYYIESKSELGCSSKRFAVEAKVNSNIPTLVSMPALEVCPGTEPALKLVAGDASNTSYRWYESTTATIPVHEGMEWITPPLESTTSYYVSALNSKGCESMERKKISVNVVAIQEPIIESPGAGLLRSTVSVGQLQWYFNDEEIPGETSNEIIIGDQVGAYSLIVTRNGCQTYSSRYADQNIVTSVEAKATTFYVYPNPADERIMIEVIEADPVNAQLLDSKGASVGNINLHQSEDRWKGEFDVTGISAGNYFIRLTSGKKSTTHQVIIRK